MEENSFTPSVLVTSNTCKGIVVKATCDHPDCGFFISHLVFAKLSPKNVKTYKSCTAHIGHFEEIARDLIDKKKMNS